MKVILIDHYDSFSRNVVEWLFACGLEVKTVAYDALGRIDIIESQRTPLVLSPGPKSPEDVPQTLQLVNQCLDQVPILGICLGHQVLASVFGGKIIPSRQPYHGSLRDIRVLKKIGPFASRALDSSFRAATYNSLVVDPESLSDHGEIIAENDMGELEAVWWQANQPTLGVQYHPESFLSENVDDLAQWWRSTVIEFYASARLAENARPSPTWNDKPRQRSLGIN